jgi:aryl-alcohol dehydrogenase-like predicted oxidoreductase
VLETLRKVAQTRGAAPAEAALAWVRQRGALAVVGARSAAQLDENLRSLAIELSPEEMKLLDEAGRLPDESPYVDMRRISRHYPY